MGNTKSIELINKYRGQIMGVSAICIVFLFINRVPSFVLGVLLGWQQQNGGLKLSRRAVNTAAAVSAAAGLILAAVTLSAWLLHILTDRVLALTGSLRSRAKCAG